MQLHVNFRKTWIYIPPVTIVFGREDTDNNIEKHNSNSLDYTNHFYLLVYTYKQITHANTSSYRAESKGVFCSDTPLANV
jgi:hypothetical protein